MTYGWAGEPGSGCVLGYSGQVTPPVAFAVCMPGVTDNISDHFSDPSERVSVASIEKRE